MVTIDKLNNWPHSLRSVLRSFLSAFISTVHHCQILLTQKPSSSHVKQSSLKQLPFFLFFFLFKRLPQGVRQKQCSKSYCSHYTRAFPALLPLRKSHKNRLPSQSLVCCVQQRSPCCVKIRSVCTRV